FSKSTIINKQYDQIDFSGSLRLTDINYHTRNQPDIAVQNALLNFNPKQLDLIDINLKFGQSDMIMGGMIKEPLNFITKDQPVFGHLNASSNLLNIKEWMIEDPK